MCSAWRQASQADTRNTGAATVGTVGPTRIVTAGMNPHDSRL